ncbi:MBL fold metallo-hydrolase [Neisseria animalis]|uniref:MBL fold metallo-hydrolase n=1 Tax=Neisseria animalis TaxID=492 RepID=A0A5P3MSP4_NEIAN|nr:MBL fold metallo-hydrolase [Neisseria animalis]QEY23811.1 MBL fold metallo-hydrolase [Neisseria animalis]ROW31591.1 MBL fold metallo-hydrolase [Neisseria animalis]VEE09776.1 hydrolase [Neisseria animalis]
MALQFEIIAVTPFRQNCTLLWDDESGDAVLTDVGGDVPHLLAEIERRGVNLRGIWLTHGHLDHAGGVVELLKHCDVPVIGPHRDDEFLLQSLPEVTAGYGFPVSPAFEPTRWLEEGEVLEVGAYRFDVLHIPGHTPGQVVFYCAEADLLIAGDVLFYETIGRTDFPRGNHEDLITNIRSKLLVLPPQTRVIAGHGRMTTIGHEREFNPFLQ